LDPFLGSGTTCEAAYGLRRNSVGIDIVADYTEMAKRQVETVEYSIMGKRAKYGK